MRNGTLKHKQGRKEGGGDSREVEEDLVIVLCDLTVDVVLLASLDDDERHVDPLVVGHLLTTTDSAISSHTVDRHTRWIGCFRPLWRLSPLSLWT